MLHFSKVYHIDEAWFKFIVQLYGGVKNIPKHVERKYRHYSSVYYA